VSLCKGSQRGYGRDLAAHLMNAEENDHVEVHEVRGASSQNLHGAFREFEAMRAGTRCDEAFFHASINPPNGASLRTDQFEEAIGRIEEKLGLTNQPRAVVFHEKNGRRHCHAVWCRIDAESMKAIPLPHTRLKLRDVSHGLYRDFGLAMPAGYANRAERTKTAFNHAEAQRARRMDYDPAELRRRVQDAWHRTDSRNAFSAALEEQGLSLAKGTKRAFVIVDRQGVAGSLAKLLQIKTREVKARLGPAEDAPSVDEALAARKARQTAAYERQAESMKRDQAAQMARAKAALADQKAAHQAQRETLKQFQRTRWQRETLQRAERFRRGVMGVWDRLSGQHGRIVDQNRDEITAGRRRDRGERETLIRQQLDERRALGRHVVQLKTEQAAARKALRREFGIEGGRPTAHGYDEHTRPRERPQRAQQREESTFRQDWTREAAAEQDRAQEGQRQAAETQPEKNQTKGRRRGLSQSWRRRPGLD
jgi:hypothetical protein